MGFFEDLSKKASETYKNTAEKTNKITREMKLKSLINEDKSKIEQIYIEIGKKVYEKHIREENIDIKSELIEECSKIDAYAKEIEDMNTEMLSLKDLRICKKCASEISINAKFCPKCGALQEETKENNQVQEINQTQDNNQNEQAIIQAPVTEIVVQDNRIENTTQDNTIENATQDNAIENTTQNNAIENTTQNNVIDNTTQENILENNSNEDNNNPLNESNN